jgi:hypothetical protein
VSGGTGPAPENAEEPKGLQAFYRRHNAQFWTTIILAVYALYLLATFGAAWRLVTTGELIGVLMGVVVVFIPLLGVWILIREIRYGATTQAMAHELLEPRGCCPRTTCPAAPPAGSCGRPRTPTSCSTRRRSRRTRTSWQSWHRLALAYDACGDRRRARDAMKRAIRASQS